MTDHAQTQRARVFTIGMLTEEQAEEILQAIDDVLAMSDALARAQRNGREDA